MTPATLAAPRVPDALVRRIKREYEEMPGLRLTFAQARRLWRMETAICTEALRALTRSGFLRRTHDGQFVLRVDRERRQCA